MKVHSATFRCSVELYKLWYTLADFLPNWDISRGFLYVCIIYIAGRISADVRAWDIIFFSLAGPVGHWGPYCDFSRSFSKLYKSQWYSGKIYDPGSPSSGLKRSILFLEILRDFLCLSINSAEGSAERGPVLFRVPRSSFRVWRSSVGCSVAREGAAYLRRVQYTSEGRSLP